MNRIRRLCGVIVVTVSVAALVGCYPYYGNEYDEYSEPEYSYEPEYESPAAAEPPPEEQYGDGISWDEAVYSAGTYQRVCGPFAGWGNSHDDIFFNLGVDYPNPDRFQIVLWDIGSVEPIPRLGSTVCVTGDITLYEGVAEVELYDPSVIELYE